MIDNYIELAGFGNAGLRIGIRYIQCIPYQTPAGIARIRRAIPACLFQTRVPLDYITIKIYTS